MTRLWVIKDTRTRRDRHGKPRERAVLGISRGTLHLAGNVVSGPLGQERLSLTRAKVLRALLLTPPGHVASASELIEYAYGDAEPEYSSHALRTHLSFLNAALKRVGAMIKNRWGFGWEVIS